MRRDDRRMNQEEALQFLHDAEVVRLGLIAEGQPYVVPMNFLLKDQTVYFHCAGEGRKLEAMANHATVCLEADRLINIKEATRACKFGCFYQSVIAYGEATVVKDDAYKANILTALTKKYAQQAFSPVTPEDASRIYVVAVQISSLEGKQNLPK